MANTNQTISGEEKQKIAEDLRYFVEVIAGGSANKASKMLKKVSNGYISLMLNNKWDAISAEMWRNVEKQVSRSGDWAFVPTKSSEKLFMLLDDSKKNTICSGIIANEGRGKTFPTKVYSETHPNVFHIKCNEFDTRKTFLMELMSLIPVSTSSLQISEMMRAIVNEIRRREEPVIIWDEGDKLSDSVLYFFITFFNMLEDQAGLVIMATPYLQHRIEKGVRLNKKGFREIYSRIGRRFISLPEHEKNEILDIIRMNGVHDDVEAMKILNQCEGDLRRVKKLVHAYKRREAGDA
ncbi:AAA family ATPase [Cyclobacterium marinum]|uniref:ORC1/DEAH AAA+ ATPase domain-containing protein n=1 Tax=Cyclobacterium marinum (strain ATCC 25205 / DSM 745 / LMG 13164 / NCIMB 1802) TaxID=880070 RepID=G0J0G0_CYCMS|nr:AAA family ATPase [Cyclobacterium marinum]AEL23876.1 hypothetical protein Cycma_0092 [Cyclobacterium marinum DSM 745]